MTNMYKHAVSHDSSLAWVSTPCKAWAPSAPIALPAAKSMAPPTRWLNATSEDFVGVGADGLGHAVQGQIVVVHAEGIFNFLGDELHADQNVEDQHHHGHSPPPKSVDSPTKVTTYKKMNFFMNML